MTDQPKTASLITEQDKHLLDQQHFASFQQDFIRRYGSQLDGRDRGDFERETYFLIQRAFAIAQQPLLDHMSKMAAAMASPTFLVKDLLK